MCIITTSSLQDKPRNATRGYRLTVVVFHDQEISNINYLVHVGMCVPPDLPAEAHPANTGLILNRTVNN